MEILKYKSALTAAMTSLASDPRRVFIGYGLQTGRAMGTLKDVPSAQIIETPVAEGLMASMAIGQSIAGKLPVVYFERCDFITNAMDAIVNHLNAIAKLSHNEFRPAVILRITVGNKSKALFTGPVHTQDFTEALRMMVSFPVTRLLSAEACPRIYQEAMDLQARGISSAIVEFKDFIQ